MPFNETNDGAPLAEYLGFANHVATSIGITIKLGSNMADGSLDPELAEQIAADLAAVVASDPRFADIQFTRTRKAVDAWSPPTPPGEQLPIPE